MAVAVVRGANQEGNSWINFSLEGDGRIRTRPETVRGWHTGEGVLRWVVVGMARLSVWTRVRHYCGGGWL